MSKQGRLLYCLFYEQAGALALLSVYEQAGALALLLQWANLLTNSSASAPACALHLTTNPPAHRAAAQQCP